MNPDNMHLWYFRNTKGEMVPLDAVATAKWTQGPAMLERYNGVQATAITASAAPGVSSGDAMEEMTRLVEKLPQGIGLEWTGLSYQEQQSGHQAPFLYALSILVVFLCLAALYESWTIPIAVMLRYLPTIREDWYYIKDAMRLRDVSPTLAGFLKAPAMTINCIYVPLLTAASKAADELSIASVTRGIENPKPRTCLVKIQMRSADFLAIVLFTAFLAAEIVWKAVGV